MRAQGNPGSLLKRMAQFRPSLRLHILLSFILVIGLLAIVLGMVAGRGSQELVDEAVSATFEGAADLAIQDLQRLEETARGAAEALAAHPIAQTASREQRRERLHAMATILRSVPGVSAAYLGWPDGQFVLLRPVGRNVARLDAPSRSVWLAQWVEPGGPRFEFLDQDLTTVETRHNVDYAFDPRSRPWFRDAAQSDGTIITAPYVFFTTREPGITAAHRALGGAVAGVDVSLHALSERLPRDQPTATTVSAVLADDGGVLAYMNLDRLRQVVDERPSDLSLDEAESLPTAASIGSPVIAALADEVGVGPFGKQRVVTAKGREWLATVMPLDAGFTFVMAVPSSEIGMGPNAIRARLLQVSGLAMLLAVPMIWYAARFIARPVESFARDVDRVARLDFSEPSERGTTQVRELADLNAAIGSMRAFLSHFSEICRRIVEEDSSASMLGGVLDALMEAGHADRGAVWMVDRGCESGQRRLVVSRGAWVSRDEDSFRGQGADVDERVVTFGRLTTFLIPEQQGGVLASADSGSNLAVLGIPLRRPPDCIVGVLVVARPAAAGHDWSAAMLSLARFAEQSLVVAMDRRLLIAERSARVLELDCLYRVLELTSDTTRSVDAVCDEVARVIPGSLRNPPHSVARIVLRNTEYRSEGWKQPDRHFRVSIGDTDDGSFIEVGRLDDAVGVGSRDEDEFSPEERAMVDAVAAHVGRMRQSRHMAATLTQTERLSAVGALTSGIAHDFNNLLTVILGNADMLMESLPRQSPLQDLAESTRDAAEAGASLTHRLLAFARKQPLAPEITAVAPLITRMGELLRRTLGAPVRVETVVIGEALWDALVDPAQLENAVLNLGLNARDAMPDGGRLRIELANADVGEEGMDRIDDVVPGEYVMVAVSDTGSGMEQDVLAHAFEPFFTTKGVGKGNGLGLSMVYGFVRQSGGFVRVSSEVGQGTVIRLYLPRGRASGPRRGDT